MSTTPLTTIANPPRCPLEDPISTFVEENETPSTTIRTPLSRMMGRSGGSDARAVREALGNVARRFPGKPKERGTRVTLPWLRWFNFVNERIQVISETGGDVDILGTAGENIADNSTVYLSDGTSGTAGDWFLTDSDIVAKSSETLLVGHVSVGKAAGEIITIRILGKITGRSGLVDGDLYYLAATPGTISTTVTARLFAIADSATSLVIIPVSGAPAGNDTEVQFNDGGVFGADADLTWDKTGNILKVTNTATSGGIVRHGRGSNTAPAMSFMGDTDTGWYQDAVTGVMNLSLNSVNAAIFRAVTSGPIFGLDHISGSDAIIMDGVAGFGLLFSNGGMGNSGIAGFRIDSSVERLCISHSSTNTRFGALGGTHLTNGAQATVSNTTTETTLIATAKGIGTSMGSNALSLAGRTMRITARGTIENTGTPTLRLRFKLGTTAHIDTGAVTLATITGTQGWEFVGEAVVRSVGTAMIGNGRFSYSTAAGTTTTHLTASTTTNAISTTIDVTAQWGTADAANVLTCELLTIEVLN